MLESPEWLARCFGELEDNFKEIYKKDPGQDYLNEWVIVTKRPENVVKKHSWILFARTSDKTLEKKLRPNQEDKIECQKIAQKVWKKYLLDIKYMKMHPEIKRIVGKQYKGKRTLHEWLSKVAPNEVKRKGVRSEEYTKEQLSICKKLNIEVPKK